jgi:hypothetical protein
MVLRTLFLGYACLHVDDLKSVRKRGPLAWFLIVLGISAVFYLLRLVLADRAASTSATGATAGATQDSGAQPSEAGDGQLSNDRSESQ